MYLSAHPAEGPGDRSWGQACSHMLHAIRESHLWVSLQRTGHARKLPHLRAPTGLLPKQRQARLLTSPTLHSGCIVAWFVDAGENRNRAPAKTHFALGASGLPALPTLSSIHGAQTIESAQHCALTSVLARSSCEQVFVLVRAAPLRCPVAVFCLLPTYCAH